MGAIFLLEPQIYETLCPKFIYAMWQRMVSMETHNAILKIGGLPTKSFISQLLLNLYY